ncbi:NADH-quinone oxidoreductase subunit C [Aliikangiella maris]|uniref:NADH-quinone oxidoreductase subunit C n=2 Tax=Aliikangiella maris TaxID=3162458 RepID=A0ABV2BSH6_9GAMM
MGIDKLQQALSDILGEQILSLTEHVGELTLEIAKESLLEIAKLLRDKDEFQFEQLSDLCAVDYLTYGQDEWSTRMASSSGFGRGRKSRKKTNQWEKPRFAVVYHLLSITLNQRLRVKVFVEEDSLMIPSVIQIWNCADWFEREAFDLFGLLFEGHPDLRRILTDYGFIGHPFRKDFPVVGNLEMRYDEEKKQCIYEPVSIEERILVPKVIRQS